MMTPSDIRGSVLMMRDIWAWRRHQHRSGESDNDDVKTTTGCKTCWVFFFFFLSLTFPVNGHIYVALKHFKVASHT